MSLIRPVVLVFQEFANPTVTAPEPDLNCLIVGPAYHIQDYYKPEVVPLAYADKAGIKLASDYGALEAAPATAAAPVGVGVLTAADVPNNKVGAIVDAASVKVYFDEARVKITNGTQATTTNGSNSITVGDGGINFTTGSTAVLPGDRVIFTDAGAKSLWRTVLSVSSATTLLLTADVDTTGGFAPGNGQAWRIERQLRDQLVDPSFYTVMPSGTGNTVSLNGGVTLSANGASKTVTYAKVYVAYRALRQDLQQVLRLQNQAEIIATLGRIDARNPLAVGAFVARQNTTTSVLVYGVQSNDLSGHGLCRDQLQPRDDIYAIVPLTSDKNVIKAWDTDNTGLAQVNETTGRPQRFRVVIGSGTLPTTETVGAQSSTATTQTVSGTAPVANQLFEVKFYARLDCGTVSGGANKYTAKLRAKNNGTAGNLITFALVNDGTTPPALNETGNEITVSYKAGDVACTAGAVDALLAGSTLVDVETAAAAAALDGPAAMPATALSGGADLLSIGCIPSDKMVVAGDGNVPDRSKTYTVAHVNDATHLTVEETILGAANDTASATVAIKDSTLAVTRKSTWTVHNLKTLALGDLYLVLKDSAGTFITSGILPGDTVQIPTDPNGTSFATYSSFAVAAVLSENRLQIVNNGANTSTLQNELPHGVKRAGSALVTQGAVTYKVIRNLNKTQQVTSLVSVAQSFSSRRTILVWPDLLDVAGVTGGTEQPGYYLACAVGGMTAGLPSHQGFTFLGISGVSQIYRANTYFSDDQLTELMQGGWYVFSQQTPQSLPFTIHQLTTDPSTLENGEFSVVKNFDYVSLFFVDILQGFLGKYNITPETLSFLRQALSDGIDTLKLRVYARIGAPLLSGEIVELGPSSTKEDRVNIKVNLGLPKPLNVIELHLVA